jgi:hypothetical protein
MRVLIAGLGIGGLVWAMLTLANLSVGGFPNGYGVYGEAVLLPRLVLAMILLFDGIVLVARSAFGRPGPAETMLALISILVLGGCMLLIDLCPHWDACASAFETSSGLTLDDGIGG